MKVVIIGGHFTPALAVIEQLPKDTKILYIGRKYTFEKDKTVSLEYQTVTKREIPFISLTTGRFQRTFSLQTLPSLGKIPYGFFQAIKILSKCKPDIVIGFGGYLSVPVCLASYILGIPFIIHEQTLRAGMSNKILARFASKICVSWKKSEEFFPQSKTILTGNPLPESMFTQKKSSLVVSGKKEDTKRPLIVVVGGSSGSHALNVLIEGCLPQLLTQFDVIHQTGDAQEFRDYDRLKNFVKKLPQSMQDAYVLTKFIELQEFMATVGLSDLVVSRSGINTITALLILEKPSLLIPLPAGQHNEQQENAILLKDAGLGEVMTQHSLTPQKLFDKIAFMLDNRKSYKYVSQEENNKINQVHSAQKIIAVLNDITEKNSKKKKESDS